MRTTLSRLSAALSTSSTTISSPSTSSLSLSFPSEELKKHFPYDPEKNVEEHIKALEYMSALFLWFVEETSSTRMASATTTPNTSTSPSRTSSPQSMIPSLWSSSIPSALSIFYNIYPLLPMSPMAVLHAVPRSPPSSFDNDCHQGQEHVVTERISRGDQTRIPHSWQVCLPSSPSSTSLEADYNYYGNGIKDILILQTKEDGDISLKLPL